MPKYLLGIDNGGTVIKAGLYDLNGREIAVATSKTQMLMPTPGHAERDANELWSANVQAIAAVIRQSGISPDEIIAVATTGHGNGLYLVDAQGNPVYPGICSTDVRAQKYVQQWYADGTFERVLPKTMQSIWAAQPVALLAWFRDHQPEVVEQARWAFMCKDYLRYRLTGEAYAEITDMSGSSLMNIRDVTYDQELFQAYGIERYADKFPPLKHSAEICGHVTKAAAEQTGLRAGTPVAGGLFDIDACGIATGMITPEKLCLVVGTWSINQYISPTPIVSKSIFMTSLYCIPGYWLVLEGSPTSASNQEWFIAEFLGEAQTLTEQDGHSIYERCNEWVAQIAPEESHIIFLPFLYGANVGWDASACFLGIKGWHHRAHLLRAIYEGVIFSHRTHIEKLLAFREPPQAIRLTGGAARSEVWMQMFADVLQTSIEITAGTELGTLGAAICGGVATGVFPSFEQAAANMVQMTRVYTPDASKQAIYAEKYAAYRQAIATLRPLS
ncbi:carbohydrate kinase FGGY [Candidatus Moduliflexus flocculans]|uniref:Carbohydrate kinase FGGY n=1 Tax=Candidatus Moduliflexus flocculans TaxID=1499966 RepID=A0A0S6VY49_9BACT|nr:carbohydrate kinase FGGY [Candidatus Moduliflexus flocculans]